MPTPKLQLSGVEHFAAPPEVVFDMLANLDQLARHIPDLESSRRVDEQTLECVVRPGFSFMRGKVNLTIRLVEAQRPVSARLATDMKGIGQAMKAESAMTLQPTSDGCQTDWQVNVWELKGLIATVSPGLVKAAAERIVSQSMSQIREELAKTAGNSPHGIGPTTGA